MTKDELRSKLIEIEIVQKEQTTLRSGIVSDLYCDVRTCFGYPEIMNALADEIGKLIPAHITSVAASGYGGLPLAAIVASRFNIKLVGVRDSAKTHGHLGLLAGYIPTEKDCVVIIDDVLTTGSSIKTTLVGLQTTNTKIESAIVVVKRGEVNIGIPCSHLYKINEFID